MVAGAGSRASSSRRSRSGWASTRRTCATSTTTPSRRASRRTRRRRAAPGATASPRCARCSRVPTIARRSRTSPTATPRRETGSRGSCARSSPPRTPTTLPSRSWPRGSTCGRSCSERRSPTSSWTATCARRPRSTPATASSRSPTSRRSAPRSATRVARSCATSSPTRRRDAPGSPSIPRPPPATSARTARASSARSTGSRRRGTSSCEPSDVRHRYRIDRRPDDQDALVSELMERFAAREDAEIGRVGMPLALATLDGCRTNALVGYFGEQRAEPCGHCSFCIDGRALPLPAPVAGRAAARGRRRVGDRDARLGASAGAGDVTPAGAAPVRHHEPCDVEGQARASTRCSARLADQRFADVLAWRERAAV